MIRDPSMTAEVRCALDELWPSVYAAAQRQLAIIRTYVSSSASGAATDRRAAWSAAHKLRGSAGLFGQRDASALAEAIEDLLAVDVALEERDELRRLVERLAELVDLDLRASNVGGQDRLDVAGQAQRVEGLGD